MKYHLKIDSNGFIIGYEYNNIQPEDSFISADKPPPPDVYKLKTRYVGGEYVQDGSLWVPITHQTERKMEYPSVKEQLDMLWHSMNNGEIPRAEPFYSTIKAVKDKYPKPKQEN